MTLEELQEEIQPADQDVIRLSEEQWMKVGKPLFSLGKLEQQITRIAGIKRIACYEIKKKALVVMCADNGCGGRRRDTDRAGGYGNCGREFQPS